MSSLEVNRYWVTQSSTEVDLLRPRGAPVNITAVGRTLDSNDYRHGDYQS